MKKTMRKAGVMVVIVAMILASVQISAFAKLPDYYYIIFNSNANHIITEGSGVGEIVVDGQNITAQDASTNSPIGEVSILNEGTEARIKIPYDDEVKLSFNTENKFDVFYQGQNYSMETVLNKDVCENWEYIFLAIQDHTNPPPAGNGGNQVGQPSNASAKVTVTGGEGGYTEKRYNPELHQDVEENVPYKKSYGDAMISINDRRIICQKVFL